MYWKAKDPNSLRVNLVVFHKYVATYIIHIRISMQFSLSSRYLDDEMNTILSEFENAFFIFHPHTLDHLLHSKLLF